MSCFNQEAEECQVQVELSHPPPNDQVSRLLCRRSSGVANQPGIQEMLLFARPSLVSNVQMIPMQQTEYATQNICTPCASKISRSNDFQDYKYQVYQPLGDSFLAALVSWNPFKQLRSN